MYNAAIIGCGWVGVGYSEYTDKNKEDTHLNAYLNNPRITLRTIIEPDTFRRKAVKKLVPNVLVAESIEIIKMMARSGTVKMNGDIIHQGNPLDIVSVCTPPSTHKQIVTDIAPFVKAIWLEKPIAETLEDADAIIQVCKDNGTLLQVNHQRRATHPKFTFSRGWLDTGTHAVDLLRQLFGEVHAAFKDCIIFDSGMIVDIEYIDTTGWEHDKSHIFELDVTHSKEPMLPKMLEDIIWALEHGTKLYSPGEEARATLKTVLEMKGDYETPDN